MMALSLTASLESKRSDIRAGGAFAARAASFPLHVIVMLKVRLGRNKSHTKAIFGRAVDSRGEGS